MARRLVQGAEWSGRGTSSPWCARSAFLARFACCAFTGRSSTSNCPPEGPTLAAPATPNAVGLCSLRQLLGIGMYLGEAPGNMSWIGAEEDQLR